MGTPVMSLYDDKCAGCASCCACDACGPFVQILFINTENTALVSLFHN